MNVSGICMSGLWDLSSVQKEGKGSCTYIIGGQSWLHRGEAQMNCSVAASSTYLVTETLMAILVRGLSLSVKRGEMGLSL